MTLSKENVKPGDPDIAVIAALAGEPARARMLMALLDGQRLPASELTRICGIAKSTASEHLARPCAPSAGRTRWRAPDCVMTTWPGGWESPSPTASARTGCFFPRPTASSRSTLRCGKGSRRSA